jgi:hypothetical protein
VAFRRKFKESPMPQGVDEQVAYVLDTTPWGGSPTNVSVVVKQYGRDVTADVTSGTASVSGDDITTPLVKSLSADKVYRLEIKFTSSGNIFEPWGKIEAEV